MIIVSQDKRDILNYDFTQRIGLDRETNFTSIVAYQNGNAEAECLWLGSYKTEERAKEVLGEIINIYKGTEAFKVVSGRILDSTGTVAINKGFVYKMPED